MKGFHMMPQVWRWRAPVARNGGEAEAAPWWAARKEMETSVLKSQGTEFCHFLVHYKSFSFPGFHPLIARCVPQSLWQAKTSSKIPMCPRGGDSTIGWEPMELNPIILQIMKVSTRERGLKKVFQPLNVRAKHTQGNPSALSVANMLHGIFF